MNSLEKFLVNPLLLIISLIIIVGIIEGVIVLFRKFGRPINKRCWLKLDCIFLVCSTLGIFGILGDNRAFFCKREMSKITYRINTYERRINSELDTTLYNRVFNTILYTQEEVDITDENFKTMHSWIVMNKNGFIKSIRAKQNIDTSTLVLPVFIAGPSGMQLQQKNQEFQYIISEYNNLVDEYNYYEDQTNKTLIEILLQLFSPIFLVFSLAYQFVKWIEERYTINQRNCYEQHNK